jgi:hypothetical protein
MTGNGGGSKGIAILEAKRVATYDGVVWTALTACRPPCLKINMFRCVVDWSLMLDYNYMLKMSSKSD